MRIRGLATFVLLLLWGACLWLFAPAVVQRVAESRLAASGFADATIEAVSLGPTGAVLHGVRLESGRALDADSVTLPWSVELLSLRLPPLVIAGARITARAQPGAGEFRLPPIPPIAVRLQAARLEVVTAAGSVVAQFDASLAAPDPAGNQRIAASGTILHQAPAPWFAPLRMSAEITATPAAARIDGRLGWADPAMRINITGGYRFDDGTGQIDLALLPIAVGAAQALAGLPALAPVFAEMRDPSGSVAMDARLHISPTGLRTSGRLLLAAIGFTTESGVIHDLSGDLAFASLAPLRLAGPERISIARIEAAIPLTAVTLDLRQAAGGALRIARSAAALLDGRVELGAVSLSGAPQRVEIAVHDVAVAAVLTQMGLAGLTGSGRLSGRLTVRVGPEGVGIEQGELTQRGPGQISYAPADAPDFGAQSAVVLGALSDLRTERLAIVFQREGRGSVARLRVEGRNPAFQDGRAVVLNLNLTGALEETLSSVLGGLQMSDTVRRAIDALVRPP
jgi:Dicarboxylate transport